MTLARLMSYLCITCCTRMRRTPVSEDVKDAFEAETISAMTSLLKDRWNGAGRKVGIRNDLHCLAWKLDLHVRSIITHGFSNGPELVTAIDH